MKGKQVKETVKYTTHAGIAKSKVFAVKDYRTAYDCLLYVVSGHMTVIKRFAEILTIEETAKLKSIFAPSRTETKKRKKASEQRIVVLNSPEFEKHCERLTAQMVAHPGFMSNSPF